MLSLKLARTAVTSFICQRINYSPRADFANLLDLDIINQEWSAHNWEGDSSMSHITETSPKKITAPHIRARKGGDPIVALTAYDYPSARLVDEAGFDFILVGDSLAQTALGYDSTLPVTLDEMIAATRAVRRAVRRALIVGDMPFGSYQDSLSRAVESAIRFVKDGGAEP